MTETERTWLPGRLYPMADKKAPSKPRKLAPRDDALIEDRYEVQCVTCLGPRDKRSHPVCGECSAKRAA